MNSKDIPENYPAKFDLSRFFAFVPRIETLILLIGFASTVSVKYFLLSRANPEHLISDFLYIIHEDILFFLFVFIAIRFVYLLKPSRITARLAFVISIGILIWSVLNVLWLLESSVQLQPGTVKLLIIGIKQVWPLIQERIAGSLLQAVLFGLLGCCFIVVFAVYFIFPGKINNTKDYHLRRMYVFIAIFIIIFISKLSFKRHDNSLLLVDAISFNSHYNALAAVARLAGKDDTSVQLRHIPAEGQRNIVLPDSNNKQLPNVIIVLLESVSYKISGLGGTSAHTMPFLKSLANQSVEFRKTNVILPYTTKAFWTVFSGSSPNIQSDYIEAIPAKQTYESLATILRRAGYKSAFFEMSPGFFECAPGLFANLGFDWAWFRENLNDPNASVSSLSGDDCKMIEPAFQWAERDDRPFLLAMITSVSHSPYKVPNWFDESKGSKYDRYVNTVRFNDYFLQKVCEKMKEDNLWENTILCVLGDHGTSFRPDTGEGRWIPYEEVIRVPWIIHWPGHIKNGSKIDWMCSQLDVTPTILSLIGFDISQAGFEGRNALREPDSDRRLYFSSWYDNSPVGFVENDRKVVYWPYLDKIFLYDLSSDPNEEKRVLIKQNEQRQKIKNDIMQWQKKNMIYVDPKRSSESFVYSHWKIFTAGRFGYAYYVP